VDIRQVIEEELELALHRAQKQLNEHMSAHRQELEAISKETRETFIRGSKEERETIMKRHFRIALGPGGEHLNQHTYRADLHVVRALIGDRHYAALEGPMEQLSAIVAELQKLDSVTSKNAVDARE
jgi:hypothetical protein